MPTAVGRQLQRLGVPDTPCEPLGGGLSECRLWRVGTPPEARVVKAWPLRDSTLERLQAIHRWLAAMQQTGIDFLPHPQPGPSGQSMLVAEDSLWELLRWQTGDCRPPSQGLGETDIDRACQLLARLHQASSQWHARSGPAPGLVERTEQLQRLLSGPPPPAPIALWQRLELPAGQPPLETLSLLWRLATNALPTLQLASQTPLRLCWIPRDIWYPHLLWSDQRPIGLIDMGAARIDWPGLDLVRLFGSYLPLDDTDRWQSVMEHYRAHRGRLEPHHALCHSLNLPWLQNVDRASLVLSIAFWLRRLTPLPSGSLPELAVHRLRELLGRLPESAWAPEQA